MKATTVRIPENTKDSIDSEASEYDLSTSEYIRKLIEYGREYYGEEEYIAELEAEVEAITDERDELAERVEELEAELSERPDPGTVEELRETVDELETELDSLEARNTDLTNQLAEANTRIDAASEIVEYAKTERSAQERWREAGLLTKAKWSVFGVPNDDAEE